MALHDWELTSRMGIFGVSSLEAAIELAQLPLFGHVGFTSRALCLDLHIKPFQMALFTIFILKFLLARKSKLDLVLYYDLDGAI
jgi:hypothetical protein